MDYKYIEQLLERYWECETSLEEEEILRTFFSQKEVPARLLPYKDVFTYEHEEPHMDTLDAAFDRRILSMTEEKEAEQKARTVTFTSRLMPLFRAAAVVAIILTLGNALQMPFEESKMNAYSNYPTIEPSTNTATVQPIDGPSVAVGDSVSIDFANKD